MLPDPIEAAECTDLRADRATTPTIGIALLIGITVALAVLVAGIGTGVPTPTATSEAAIDVTVTADADRITLVHRGGTALDVEALSLWIAVDGEPLDEQPPIPFFSATGFRPGPTGPFNAATDGRWAAGQRASVRLASTNAPTIDPGDQVTVRLLEEGDPIVTETTTAQ